MATHSSFHEFLSCRFSKLQTELVVEHEAKLEQLLVEIRRLNAALGGQPDGFAVSALSTTASPYSESEHGCTEELSQVQGPSSRESVTVTPCSPASPTVHEPPSPPTSQSPSNNSSPTAAAGDCYNMLDLPGLTSARKMSTLSINSAPATTTLMTHKDQNVTTLIAALPQTIQEAPSFVEDGTFSANVGEIAPSTCTTPRGSMLREESDGSTMMREPGALARHSYDSNANSSRRSSVSRTFSGEGHEKTPYASLQPGETPYPSQDPTRRDSNSIAQPATKKSVLKSDMSLVPRPGRALRFSFQPENAPAVKPPPPGKVGSGIFERGQNDNSPRPSRMRIAKSALQKKKETQGDQKTLAIKDLEPVTKDMDRAIKEESSDKDKGSLEQPVEKAASAENELSTIDDYENVNYALHDAWRHYVKDYENNVLRRTLSRTNTNVMDIYKEAEEEEEGTDHHKSWFARRLAVHPTSTRRLLWDLLSFGFVCYDAVMIPLQFFDPPETSVTEAFAHGARIFWTFDIIWSFLTIQMNVDGDMQTDFAVIAYHYITTWFFFDLFIVVVDWVDLISSLAGESSNSSSAIRSMRVLRAIRLLRLMRLVRNSPEISRLLATYIRSERTKVIFGVTQITVIVIGITHVIACCWYGVSVNTDGDSWVKKNDLENASLQARYVSSFYWSMVQFTGSGIMTPENNSERVFGCFVLMIAFMISVSIVSSLTTLMTRLQLITAQTTRQLSVLHRYLIDHKISSKLASRVQRNASHALAELRKNTPETGVELLELVSKPLRVELRFEVNGPILSAHPFFSCYGVTNPGGIRQVCFLAVSDLTLSAGDIVFNKGEKVDESSMLFVLKGKVKYSVGDNMFALDERILEFGQWICEAVLWVNDWTLQGALRAKSECKLLCLHADRFQATSAAFRTTEFYPAHYGVGFLQDLNLVKKMQLTDIAEDIININGIVRSVFPDEITAKTKHVRRQSSGINKIGHALAKLQEKAGKKEKKKRHCNKVQDCEWAPQSTLSTDFTSVLEAEEDYQVSTRELEDFKAATDTEK